MLHVPLLGFLLSSCAARLPRITKCVITFSVRPVCFLNFVARLICLIPHCHFVCRFATSRTKKDVLLPRPQTHRHTPALSPTKDQLAGSQTDTIHWSPGWKIKIGKMSRNVAVLSFLRFSRLQQSTTVDSLVKMTANNGQHDPHAELHRMISPRQMPQFDGSLSLGLMHRGR